MNQLTRKLATVASSLALAASGLLLASSPASAATSCYGSSCNGLDPAATICQNDAQTVRTSAWGVELRYSPTCRAAWARKTSGGSLDTSIHVQNTQGTTYSTYYGGSGSVWTRMVNDKDIQAWACETRAYETLRTQCTGGY
ncbi:MULTISPECIES: DUF2690 domain-containing protein [unclassified Streptomyces]|uniref:DUF2690 domain-containing protein n=1 Tax=unclassified Streptomyces TaxID=2593676 RepID=UPI0038260CF6